MRKARPTRARLSLSALESPRLLSPPTRSTPLHRTISAAVAWHGAARARLGAHAHPGVPPAELAAPSLDPPSLAAARPHFSSRPPPRRSRARLCCASINHRGASPCACAFARTTDHTPRRRARLGRAVCVLLPTRRDWLGTTAPEIGRRCMHEQEEERRRRRRKRRRCWPGPGGPSRRRQGVRGPCRVHGRRPPRGVGLRRLLHLVPPLPPPVTVPPQPDRRPVRFVLISSSSISSC